MMNDMTMMMYENDVIGINQCPCLPKLDYSCRLKSVPSNAEKVVVNKILVNALENRGNSRLLSVHSTHLSSHPHDSRLRLCRALAENQREI